MEHTLHRNLEQKGNLEQQGKMLVRGGMPNVVVRSPHFASFGYMIDVERIDWGAVVDELRSSISNERAFAPQFSISYKEERL